MSAVIERQSAPVFYAPTARRRYFSLSSAVMAEARARMNQKHPPERAEPEVGERGWHWRDDERLSRVFDRYARMMQRAARKREASR